MAVMIPVNIKAECCRMKEAGIPIKDIYYDYFLKESGSECSFRSFKRSIMRWEKKTFPDDTTLKCGTYEGFIANGATVQVSKTGEIVQAWIRQKALEFDVDEFMRGMLDKIEPYRPELQNDPSASRMLEIPLFDMHWGVMFFDDYKPVLDDVLELINSRHWDRIVIPFGQDFFHNDSVVNAQTTKGTVIDKVDMLRAVKDGRRFITTVIDSALENSNEVKVIYSPGNHDRSVSWMFMQVLLERYGDSVVNDSMEYRKVITYGKNAIMVTHGDSKRATAKNLAHIFPISYPEEFAQTTTREVHSGHLHQEGEADIFGVMVRRLSSGVTVDDWSNREDFVGSHRRFMIFEWDRDKLRSIHYV